LNDYLKDLNDRQKEAVEHIEGPSLIIAGAGSGKTSVLTTRIAYLIDHGIDPFNILALTFTNKAAAEMRSRIEMMVGKEARNLWMGTFHSMFARILRIECERIGYSKDFTIYDTDDSKNVIKSIVNEEQLDIKVYKPSYIYSKISLLKNNLITANKYLADDTYISEDIENGKPRFGDIYLKYTQKCFKNSAMDFDDLLLKTYELLEKYPDILNKYQQKFKFVLIDEFQDTNVLQYMIVKNLSAAHRNLSVVGDDSQSIYSFRGANIKNILDFEKDYPELKVFKLEQNYRSTKTIVSASDEVIKRNKFRLEKKLWTENDEGNKIKLIKANSESDESDKIALSIIKEKRENGFKNEDFVVLYRTNAQSRAFEESFSKNGIPYKIVGSISFYQRKEIKDILAYFKFVINPLDEEALKRIVNYPARGIGDNTMQKLIVWAREKNVTVWDVMCKVGEYGLGSRHIIAINDFAMMIKSFMVMASEKNAYETAHHIAKTTGILSILYEDRTIEGISRYDNVKNLLSAIGEYVNSEREEKSLGTFLQQVSLLTDADTSDSSGDKVTLMTVHSAKGLEFPVVCIVGLEENLFPSGMSIDTREEVEEERRLFYVAMTRARIKIYISYAISRYKWGSLNGCEPSRFLEEIDPRFIDYSHIQPVKQPIEERTSLKQTINIIPKKSRISYQPASDFRPDENLLNLQTGMEVEHNRFGIGKVLQVEGVKDNMKATIFFKEIGQKLILVKYAKMRIIN
jgi:DNA helicase II / ATP-dependent DNA helicase PcrA